MDRVYRIVKKMNNARSSLIKSFWHYWLRVVYSCDIMPGMVLGENVRFAHAGLGVVINPDVILGNNVKIGCNVIIGGKNNLKQVPIIGDNVQIGANSVIVGPIKIGNNSIIGAGSVVVKNVPENVIVAGNPAKIIRYIKEEKE